MTDPLRGPLPLASSHDHTSFDCGCPPLNDFLRRHALANQRNGSCRTYVALRGESRTVGYYSLAAAAAEHGAVPARIARGLARHPIPLTLLARLAVDLTEQRRGLGAALLKDALKRHLQAQEIVASRALVVHAKDEGAADFYRRFGFQPSPIDPYHLYLLTKDIRASLG
ncbi:MAG: GNAT family N-acetyltransferase [Betaproteobacteria bacterium]|nr:GNAT family N-acetyltransferase [Betaproteobacteria bacterium]